MTFALCYWILMVIWLLGGIYINRTNLKSSSPDLLLFVLMILVGWKLFGPPIHD